ncbi:hypothetical protein KC318_g1138 [Hortaea werneckii]|nr:hypothetical protein KC334_g1196 [Hortaea werneckii]KAI7004985.1 hypothetical protein KC355_g8438 [Hortaea werneckii]KAI7675153.1 hypothetical protein KC318_g1138 [Hortaea werneckii]
MASTQERIALRNENLKKVLPFINSNRGKFSGRPAQETALDGFLQGTNLFKFQTGSKVKIQHNGKTLRDQLRAAIKSEERSIGNVDVADLFARGMEVFQPAFLRQLGIEDTANAEVEQSTDQASGAASNSEQSSSARATSMWPAEQQQPASSSQHESQPQHHPALDKVSTDSSRESPMTEVLGGEVPASPPNRKRKNRQEPEGVEGMPPIKSPLLASEVSSERTAASPIRKRKLDTAGLEPEQEEGRQASKSPRLDLGGREQPFEVQAAMRRDARKSSEPSARSHTSQNSPGMGISSQSMVPKAPDASMAAGLSSKRQALANTLETSHDGQHPAITTEAPKVNLPRPSDDSSVHQQKDANSVFRPTPSTDHGQQQSNRNTSSDGGKAGSAIRRAPHEYEAIPGESLEAREARLTAIDPRFPTNKDLHAGRVQAPLKNVRERHAEAIGETLLDHLYPPEVEAAGPLTKNIHLLLLRQGHNMIQKCMYELAHMMHGVVSSFARENDLDDSAESAFVQRPSQELEELYSQVFGSKEWRAAWLNRLNRQEPCIYRMPMVLDALMGAMIHREVFQKETPWDVEQNLRSRMGYAVKALEEAMGDRGHSFRNVVKHAQFKLYDSKEFQDETIEPYARKIADSLAMTLVPHLIAQKKHQYPNADAHFFEAPCSSDEWVRKLREVFKFALILHGKINGANDATYEYIWFKPGSIWDGQQRSVDVPHDFPRKSYEVILTWLPAIKVEYLPGTIRPEATFASPARCWLDVNGERAGVAGKSTN